MDRLPPECVYAILRRVKTPGPHIARMACVSTRYRGMAGDLLWRWHCRDALADSFSREDSQGDADGDSPLSESEIRNRVVGRERLQRQVARMRNGDAAALGKLFNVCPGVTPAHLQSRSYWTGAKFRPYLKPPPWVAREVEKHDRRVLSKPHCENFAPTFKLLSAWGGNPRIFALMSMCKRHIRTTKLDMRCCLLQGLIVDFRETEFYDAFSEYPFMKDEFCPFCSSEVWNGCEVQVMFKMAFAPFLTFNPNVNVIVPTIVHCVCTKGHWYGMEREEDSDDEE
ncbi:unnamed protein product [Closterium sp. Yama58-4]|nr:unnamed protein product [Closterium sp. Yama58-4]